MSNQTLTPFKAYFEFQYNDSLEKLYPENLEMHLEKTSEDNKTVKTATFLKKYLTGANISILKKETKIDFDYHTCHSIYPESFSISNLKQNIEFKIKSKEVDIIQIIKNDITFRSSNGEIRTETLDSQIKLFNL
jgi:hypothetical protein